METGTELRSYDLAGSYSMVRFYNDEKGVILTGYSRLEAMDLETEEVAYLDEYIIGMYGTHMDIIANGTKIVHAGNEKISVFDIDGKDVVSLVSNFFIFANKL